MMRRAPIKPRSRIFIGCEGQSEQSYVRLLQEFSSQAVHLDSVLLQPGGGDAAALLERAKSKHDWNQKLNGSYKAAFLLLDKDKLGNHSPEAVERHALRAGIILVWQDPCHEAFLLRHFPGCHDRQPAGSDEAMAALRRQFIGFEKAMHFRQLQRRITLDMIRQAAGVTAGFQALLDLITPP